MDPKKLTGEFLFCVNHFKVLYPLATLLRRGSQLSIVCFIIARVAADGPGPFFLPWNLCDGEYPLAQNHQNLGVAFKLVQTFSFFKVSSHSRKFEL